MDRTRPFWKLRKFCPAHHPVWFFSLGPPLEARLCTQHYTPRTDPGPTRPHSDQTREIGPALTRSRSARTRSGSGPPQQIPRHTHGTLTSPSRAPRPSPGPQRRPGFGGPFTPSPAHSGTAHADRLERIDPNRGRNGIGPARSFPDPGHRVSTPRHGPGARLPEPRV